MSTKAKFRKVDEFKTNRYRVEVEFYGIDAKNSLRDVVKYAEWNLANNGGAVTKLSVKKIPKTSATFQAYEWSIVGGTSIKAFKRDPQGFMQKAVSEQLRLKGKKVKVLPAPKARKGAATLIPLTTVEKIDGKCYVTNLNQGDLREVPCPTPVYHQSSCWLG